jgi:hypothetical protein
MPDQTTYCPSCGAAREGGAAFCSACGGSLSPARPSMAPTGPLAARSSALPPPPPPPRTYVASGSQAVTDEPYPSTTVLVAVLLTLAAPFISLVAALVLMQDQRSEARRGQLKSWAIGSGVWLAIGGLIFISVVASVMGGGGPGTSGACKGGINRMIPPSYEGSSSSGWTAIYVCYDGGTLRRPSHAAWLDN